MILNAAGEQTAPPTSEKPLFKMNVNPECPWVVTIAPNDGQETHPVTLIAEMGFRALADGSGIAPVAHVHVICEDPSKLTEKDHEMAQKMRMSLALAIKGTPTAIFDFGAPPLRTVRMVPPRIAGGQPQLALTPLPDGVFLPTDDPEGEESSDS